MQSVFKFLSVFCLLLSPFALVGCGGPGATQIPSAADEAADEAAEEASEEANDDDEGADVEEEV